jgi:hypothetical protein
MYGYQAKFTAFGGPSVYEWTRAQNVAMVKAVSDLTDAKLLEGDAEQLVTELAAQWQVAPPTIDTEHYEPVAIPKDEFASRTTNWRGQPDQVAEYRLAATGNLDLLKLCPSSARYFQMMRMPELHMATGGVAFDIAIYAGNVGVSPENQVNAMLDCLRANTDQLRRELEQYNANVSSVLRQAVAAERQRRQQQKDAFNKLPRQQ